MIITFGESSKTEVQEVLNRWPGQHKHPKAPILDVREHFHRSSGGGMSSNTRETANCEPFDDAHDYQLRDQVHLSLIELAKE